LLHVQVLNMRIRKLTAILLCFYALLTTYTLISLLIGIGYHPFFTPLLTLIAFIFALLHGSQNLGWRHTLLLLALTMCISLLFECVGVATGWVYGPYHYTAKLGPKFLGLVPLLIPIAWFMMTYPSYVIATRLIPAARKAWTWRIQVAALGALIMTAWDLAMDPMMVAGGHWVWDQPGAYFGIPLQNYLGWWLTTFITFFLFLSLARTIPEFLTSTDLFDRLPILSYAITGLSSLLTDFIFGLSGPALVGIFAMLPWVLLANSGNPKAGLH
jgi:carotene biosynthesis associated membrane protein